MKIVDITPLVSERIGVFPGDTPYRRTVALSLAAGDNIDLSAITTTVHLGAHTDAPNHYDRGGVGIAARSLDRYYGACEVIRVAVSRGERIRPHHLPGAVRAPRVLFHTGSFPDPDTFTTDFCSLSPELVHVLADAGVVLVGIDTPSIDPCDDGELLSHQAVAEHDLGILEGIVLTDVDPGLYTLIALPLKLEGADGSPVRAVLLAEGS